MSIRLGEWGSSEESEPLVCEGITQQPGPFYNGNFSSSIWGNPPTPPLWRDMPEPNAVCSTSGAQPFGSFSSCQHAKESVFSCKIENTLNGKEEKVSKWAGDFPFRQQAGPHESSSSPFSFGFPPSSPSPASLSSSCAHITLNGSGYSQSHLAGKSVGANSHKDLFNRKSFMVDKGSGQCSNGEKAFSLKELSSKWESILQSQDGPYCSIDSQSPLCNSSIPESSAGLASPKDIKQTPEHSYGKPFANADNVANSLNKEQPVEQHSHGNKFVNADNDANCLLKEQPVEHNYGNPFANADLYSNSLDKMQPLKHTHDNPFTNAGMYATPLHAQRPLFTSIQSAFTSLENCNRKPPLFSQKCDSGTFVFGSCAASGFGANVGLSQQKDACSSAAGSMPRSVITNSKFKKHNTFANKKHSTALGSRAFQSGPSKPSSDTNNSVLKFTMGANSADRSHCPDLANSGHGPASNLQNICASAQNNSFSFGANKTGSQAPSFSSVAARIVTEDTHPSGSSLDGNLFQQRNKNQYAQSIGNKFSTWHPFLQEERSIKTCGLDKGFVGVTSSDGTSSWNNSHKVHEKWEASGIKAGFSHEELPKPSLVKNRTFEGSKLAEFDLNSPNNLSAEDLREKAAKWVRPGEEIKRQKENQEPNFVFGSQKASGPFVFSASRTSGSMKHATLSTDDMNKKEWRSKGNKESKVLEHLIDKLGERMASLGKSHTTQSNHAAYREETVAEGMKEFDASSKGSWTKVAKGSLHAADIFEKNIALSHSIEELREQLAKLGRCGNEINEQKAKAGQANSSLCGNSIALEHAVKELCEQISKLGKFGEVKEEDTAGNSSSSASEAQHAGSCDNSAIMHAVEELSEQIAKLGRAVRGNDQCDCSYGKAYPSGIKQQSAQDLCKKMATPGKLDKEENNHNMSPESMSTPNVIKGQGAFVFSACNATTSEKSGSIPFHWSKTYASDSRGASFNNTAQFNPSSTVSQSTLFPSNAFAGTQSSSYLNPFTAGQASPFAGIHNGAKFSFYEMPSYSNAAAEGSPQKVFEFHGIKEPPSGTTMNRKNGRACPNMCRRDKKNVTRKNKSSVLQGKIHSTSSAHSTGSPMDSSPYADQNASSPNFGSNKTEQDPGWKSPGPNFVQAESISVEELRMATSNLTLGKEDESRMGDQEKSRSFEHQSDQSSPFVLHQKKGTWKRASRNKSNANLADSKMQFTSGPKTASSGACGIDKRGAEGHTHNSFSGEGFNQRSSSVFADNSVRYTKEMPVRKSMWNQGSSVINGKGENITPVFASTKPNQSLRFDKLGKEQKASLSGELPATPTGTRTATSEQVCENWRLRGNQAYAKGDYEKAEDCYTRGVGSVLPMDTSQSCIRASMLCYSNRAATRMAVGRMREALEDCKRAMMLDSGFLRVRLRAASCHLALGENTAAAALFAECWNCAKESNCSDVKIMEEAMEGMRKSQRFGDLSERALKLCQGESSTDASAALNLLNEALLICPFSEALLELKAQTLFSAQRFEDALQLCQQTLPAAEENIAVEQHPNQLGAKANVSLNLWRWRMCGKCFFHLGRLEESASLLTKYEEATCRISFNMAANIESMAALLSTICNLLQHKASGNEAFQAGRHDEAIEHYTAALACNGESRPYNAVCFCNRAAASQALGHIADAIADCSRAIVLDSHYAKAISRRATLHEMVGDYGQTCNDLRRLIALLEGQETCLKSPKSTRAGSKSAQDLRQARDRLEKATKELKKDCAVDHYLILGLDVSCSSNEIKKAYRKAALKHHPDKACQVLVRGENSDDGSFWKEIGDEARRDAERLFKLIGEAYATLSDPTKRSQYDFENHVPRARNPTHAGYGSADDNFSPGEKSGRQQRERREWHSSRYYRWQSGPDAAQPDTYSERGSRDSSASKDGRNKGRRSDFYW